MNLISFCKKPASGLSLTILSILLLFFTVSKVNAQELTDPCLSVVINEVNPSTEQVELFNPTANLCVFGSADNWRLAEASGYEVGLVGGQVAAGGFLIKEFTSNGAGNLKDSGDKVNLSFNDQILDSIEWGRSLTAKVPEGDSGTSLLRAIDGQSQWFANSPSSLGATNNIDVALLPTPPSSIRIDATTNSTQNYINQTNQNNVSVNLTNSNNNQPTDKFTVILSDQLQVQSNQQTGTTGNLNVSGLDASNLVDGPITIRAYSRKNTYYSAWASGNAIKDTIVAQTAMINNPIKNVITNNIALIVEGKAEINSLIRIFRDVNHNNLIDDSEKVPVAEFSSLGGAFRFEVSLENNKANYFLINSNDQAGNTSALTIVPDAVQDSLAPTAPEKLTLTDQNNGKLLLTWMPTSDSDLAGYRIYYSYNDQAIDFTKALATTSKEELAYQTDQLAAGKYTFTVRSFDAAGNESTDAISSIVLVSPLNTAMFDQTNQTLDLIDRYGLNLMVNNNLTKRAQLTVFDRKNQLSAYKNPSGDIRLLDQAFEITTDDDEVFPIQLKFYYTADQLKNVGINENQLLGIHFYDQTSGIWQTFPITGVDVNNVTINGKDYEGFIFATANHLTPIAFAFDTTAPAKPINFLAKTENKKILLSWDKVIDAASYEVRYRLATNRDNVGYTVIKTTNTSLTIENLSTNQLYEFGVRALDLASNSSDFSVVNQTLFENATSDQLMTPIDDRSSTNSISSSVTSNNQSNQIVLAHQTEEKIPQESVENDNNSDEETLVDNDEALTDEDEGEIKGGQKDRDRAERTRALITFLIIAAAAAAGFGGYYGYQWWIEKPDHQIPPREYSSGPKNNSGKNKIYRPESTDKKTKQVDDDDGRW